MAEDAVAVGHSVRREGARGIVEILAVLAGRQRRHEAGNAVGVGGVSLQALRKGRQQRLERQLGLLLRQVELARQEVDPLAVLRIGQHVEQGKHGVVLLEGSAEAEPSGFRAANEAALSGQECALRVATVLKQSAEDAAIVPP